ncbi:hypothetical protein ACOMHN_053171 [Nucella lapillus]
MLHVDTPRGRQTKMREELTPQTGSAAPGYTWMESPHPRASVKRRADTTDWLSSTRLHLDGEPPSTGLCEEKS